MRLAHLTPRSTCLAVATAALAATAAAAPTALPTPAAPLLGEPAPTQIEPQVLNTVTEDDQVRINELRVGGATRKITVQPKIKGMPSYEIAAPTPGRAPGTDPQAGKRVWLSLDF
jgi:hypothetical protein